MDLSKSACGYDSAFIEDNDLIAFLDIIYLMSYKNYYFLLF